MNMLDERQRMAVQVRVGAFVLAALLVFVGVIYLLGARARLFENKYTLYADFDEVGGLVEGATVRLAGVQIGRVTAVKLPGQPGGKVRVELRIASQFANRIRKNSVARIETQGLLGDKIVEVTVGAATEPAMQHGEVLATREPADLGRILGQGSEVVTNIAALSESLRQTAAALNESGIIGDFAATAGSARRVAEQVERGRGLAHALIYEEPAALRKLDRLLTSTQKILDRAERGEGAIGVLTSKSSTEAARKFVRAMDRFAEAADPKTGRDGLIPTLLFDPKYRAVAEDLRVLAKNFREVSERLAAGHGMLGGLLKADTSDAAARQIVTDLRITVANFRKVSEQLNSGQGTLGALIKDPTVYENLSAVLEGSQRSRLLRSLIQGLGERGRNSTTSPTSPTKDKK
jgi:phospholipid/cholesterol/gamma-HCH transport system substrate-binding protein